MNAVLLVVVTGIGLSSCTPMPNCCGPDKDNIVVNGKECLDGSILLPNCKEVIAIGLDEIEDFHIDKDKNLIMDGEDPFPPDAYCAGVKNETTLFYLCFDVAAEKEPDKILTVLNTVLQLISVLFILLTVGIYLWIPELQDVQGIIIMHAISGLGMGYIFLITLQLAGVLSDRACHVLAYSTYFSLMYAFFWLNALCFYIWHQVIQPNFLKKVVNWKNIYHIYGLGGPTICLALVIFVNHAKISALEKIHPGVGEGKCWFRSLRETFIYFYGPVSILLVANIIYFVWTATVLWKQCVNNRTTKVLNYRLRLYTKLFLIMGITWIFEIISASLERYRIQWAFALTDAANALEGLTIFLILVVFRKRVKRHLANKKIFNCTFPARWRQENDSECDPIEEEINLSVKS